MARVTMLLDNDFSRDHRVLKEGRSLVRAGHVVRLIALRAPGLPDHEVRDGIRVERVALPHWSGRQGLAQIPEQLLWYQRMAPLGRRAAERPADVVHANDLTTLGAARQAARRLGAALVYDDHELYVETLNTTYPLDRGPFRTALYRAVERYLVHVGKALEARWVRGLDGHVTVSGTIADEIAKRYGCPRPIVVANCPPHRDPPAPDGRLRRAVGVRDARLVLYHGTFPASGAGLEDLIGALTRLPARVHLAYLGWGWGREMLERTARDQGVADRVHFLDPVPPDEIPGWVADADVATIPNRPVNLSNLYALPNKLFESMMAGTPVVAADTPEVRRVLSEHPAGVMYPMGDVETLARRILDIVDAPPDAREAFRVAARRATGETWCWERQEDKLLVLYGEILARRRSACTTPS